MLTETCLIEVVHPLEGLLMCDPRLLATLLLFLPHTHRELLWCALFRAASCLDPVREWDRTSTLCLAL